MSKKHKMEYFDDCPVCKAMKEADEQSRNLSLPEIKVAFKEAKDQGAVVGGEWFEDEEEGE